MPTSEPKLSHIAPSFRVTGVCGNEIELAAFAGEPVVIAFMDAWASSLTHGEIGRTVRAELRGLGAALIIVASDGIYCFRSDDDAQLLVKREELLDGQLSVLRWRYRAVEGSLSLFVIDGDRILRFASRRALDSLDCKKALATALSRAGKDVIARRSAPAYGQVSRREVIVTSLLSAFALVLAEGCNDKEPPAPPSLTSVDGGAAATPSSATHEVTITLNVNGTPHSQKVEPNVTLLDALRERMGLTGTKKGCDQGQCGACTVLIDDRRVNACLVLAVMAEGTKIRTIEGLATDDALHPVQAAFVSEDALQCGYCTPGQIMSAVGLLKEGRAVTDDDVREHMSGNICRCGAYANIVSAIQIARKRGPA